MSMRQKVLSILALLMVSVVSTTHLHAASLGWYIRQIYQSANSSALANGYAAYMFVTANTTDVTVSNVTTLSDVTTLISQGNISDAIALATASGSVSDGRISQTTDISYDFSTGTLTAFAIIFDAADAASAEHYFLVNGGNTSSVTFTSGTGLKTISFGNQNSGETSSTVAANWRSVQAPATQYDLTVGESLHGTVAFSVDGTAATQAKKDDVVTVTVTPAEGYSTKDVTVRAYTTWEAALARGMNRAPGLLDEIAVTKNETDGTWTFTMPEANVWVVATYTKNVQDAWIEAIADQTYTGSAIEPTVTVKDGETTLTLGTDYTVAYENNVETGTATVTVTGTGDYSGEATATFTIVADKSNLDDAITEAEAYYSTISESNLDAAAVLLTAINAAKDVQDNADATQEEVNNALSALTTAKTTAEDAVLTETKTALNNAITEAEAYYSTISESNLDAAAVLLTAINAAKDVQDNADATQAEVEAAIAALASARTTAEQTVLTETKGELNDAISAAEAYYESIKDSHSEAAATLKDAIDAAKAVKDNAEATQAQVEAAISALATAQTTATVEVSRVTITIPAKSYVARIDAENRKIETAVAGVSLYTVNNVSDSQVVLSDALNVVAAAMPYLIYNDNDEEIEVSIVLSTEEADAVEYDSEHFKGTLVDKTFTDEDMEEADHYVLSNGQDFVWVKDAGTLSAGKCWIELSVSAGNARRLVIVHEGTTTGINAVNAAANMDGNIYDLQGRRVMQPTKGLFIVNGKKVVIK